MMKKKTKHTGSLFSIFARVEDVAGLGRVELGDSSRASHHEDGVNETLNEGVGDDNEEENSYSLDFDDEDLDGVSDEDDSEIDKELRAFRENLRQEKRNEAAKSKERFKKSSKNQEVELGEAGIDKGFENIFKNKEAKYIGRLGGNEEFISSSNEPSEDSDKELDVLAQSGVDLPSRRKSKKLSSKELQLFPEGLVFDNEREILERTVVRQWMEGPSFGTALFLFKVEFLLAFSFDRHM
ncbi:hypothetical protein H5410_004638 [Solanum commersonii]|uniref:Uncharacterized protein n=1 Tax=Solanum commersonii TaxID=4109 RepID=A0A9J6B8C9_SOLCO|nr:hypothetical protein H5410_004638 [Solanum commersonii]